MAHVEQLVMSDAFKEVDYFEEWKFLLQETYCEAHPATQPATVTAAATAAITAPLPYMGMP